MILSREEIEKYVINNNMIDNFTPDNLSEASYDLRLNDHDHVINGEYIKEKVNTIKIKPRSLAILSSMESLNLPPEICAHAGLSFSVTRLGLIQLFGPQVDPCYCGRFYGAVYNVTSEEIELYPGEKFFKIEFCKVIKKDNNKCTNKCYNIKDNRDTLDYFKDITSHSLGNDIDNMKRSIEKLEKETYSISEKINTIYSGYRDIIFFGIFLIVSTLYGYIISLLHATSSMQQLNKINIIFISILFITFIFLSYKIFEKIR